MRRKNEKKKKSLKWPKSLFRQFLIYDNFIEELSVLFLYLLPLFLPPASFLLFKVKIYVSYEVLQVIILYQEKKLQ